MINKILSRRLVCSVALVFITFTVCFALNGFTINTSGDDYGMYFFIRNGDVKNIFSNYFLSIFLIPIQKFVANINVYVFLELLMNMISFASLLFVILSLKKATDFKKIISLVTVCALFSSFYFVRLQWTLTATICSTVGYVLLLYTINNIKDEKYKIPKISVSVILLIYGAFLRITSFLIVSAFFIVLLFCFTVELVAKNKKASKSLRKSIFISLKKVGKYVVIFTVIIVTLFSMNMLSESIKLSYDGYKEYKEYNSGRSSVVDFDIAPYDGNEEFYNSIDIYSQNDLDVYKSWCLDSTFFTTERLKKISDYSKMPELGIRFSFSRFCNLVSNYLKKILPINPLITLSIICFITLIVIYLLQKFRDKIRFIFPIIYIIMWSFFFYIFRLREANYLLLLFAIISSITIFLFNFKYMFRMFSISLYLIGFYIYVTFTRPIFRVTFTFSFPALIILIIFIIEQNKTNDVYLLRRLTQNRMLSQIVGILIIVSSVLIGISIGNSEVKKVNHSNIYNYCIDNKDNLYVSGPGHGMSTWFNNSQNAIFTYDIPENVIITAWIDGSEYDIKKKDEYNVPDLYKDIINNSKAYYITTEECSKKLTKYYNDHYSLPDKDIVFVKVDDLRDNNVYKIVTK